MEQFKTTRSLAIEWWNSQTDEYKGMQFRQYQRETFTPATDFGLLTGREIERIYFNVKLSERAISENPQTETMVEDWDLYPGNEAGAFDHLDNLEDDIYGRHPQIKEEDVQVGGLPDKLDVHSTGLFPMKAELHPINDPDGLINLADVQTMELANEIVKRYNNFDAMYSSLQKLIRYSELLANNSHASRHVPIEEAKAIINQIDKQ
jgi:hypothetical protein